MGRERSDLDIAGMGVSGVEGVVLTQPISPRPMPGWNPDALVSRAAATHATVSDVEESADAWRSAAAKYEQKRWAEHSELGA